MKDLTGSDGSAADDRQKCWEQVARDHPGMEFAHERACTELQKLHPLLTLRQLRISYPHVQFHWPKERVEREAQEEVRRAREVLRRGVFELLYLVANLAIAGGGLLWLYQLLTHKPALKAGLFLAAAVALSLLGYHFARWRASATVWRQVEKLMASLIAVLGVGLVCGGICFALTFGALRWFGGQEAVSVVVGVMAGLCGFAYMVDDEWSELRDCLALPATADPEQEIKA
ncbi:MAG TPA: hypothetical protein VGI32_06395 [Steroidobacteraceae bacterium]